ASRLGFPSQYTPEGTRCIEIPLLIAGPVLGQRHSSKRSACQKDGSCPAVGRAASVSLLRRRVVSRALPEFSSTAFATRANPPVMPPASPWRHGAAIGRGVSPSPALSCG